MASIYIGINLGQIAQQGPDYVAEGSSTQGTDFELRVDTGKGSTRKDVAEALRVFANYILDGRTSTFPI